MGYRSAISESKFALANVNIIRVAIYLCTRETTVLTFLLVCALLLEYKRDNFFAQAITRPNFSECRILKIRKNDPWEYVLPWSESDDKWHTHYTKNSLTGWCIAGFLSASGYPFPLFRCSMYPWLYPCIHSLTSQSHYHYHLNGPYYLHYYTHLHYHCHYRSSGIHHRRSDELDYIIATWISKFIRRSRG